MSCGSFRPSVNLKQNPKASDASSLNELAQSLLISHLSVMDVQTLAIAPTHVGQRPPWPYGFRAAVQPPKVACFARTSAERLSTHSKKRATEQMTGGQRTVFGFKELLIVPRMDGV